MAPGPYGIGSGRTEMAPGPDGIGSGRTEMAPGPIGKEKMRIYINLTRLFLKRVVGLMDWMGRG